MTSFVVQITESTLNVVMDTALTPKVVEIQVPGLQGPQGPTGPQGTAFFVSATPPPDPMEGDLWLDIS